MLTIHTTGNWPRGQVRVTTVASTRQIIPEVESAIESQWRAGKARLGERLFDGSMCRLESWNATSNTLDLAVSPTSYRIFFGTNLGDPRLIDQFGTDVSANSVGLSAALLTSDGWLLFGRRNEEVAYYPNRVHPFAGSLEDRDLGDVFGAAERELREELKLGASDIESIRCMGIAQDNSIRHPELIFQTRTSLTRSQVESQVHADEHAGSVAIEAQVPSLERAIAEPADFTPMGIAALLLFGRNLLGEEWFRARFSAALFPGRQGERENITRIPASSGSPASP